MSKMIQIRHVPDDIHKKLKLRAVMEGKSLSDFLLDELSSSIKRPTVKEFMERLKTRSSVSLKTPTADLLRADRDSK